MYRWNYKVRECNDYSLYSGSSPNGHSCMQTALPMDAFAKSEMFFSTPIQTLYYLQLWAPFLRPEGVCSRELPLYKYMPLDG